MTAETDLISRQAAIDELIEMLGDCFQVDEELVDAVVTTVEELPSAQPEQKTGKWLWADGVRCSVCNHKLQSTGLPSYCPNCGAKMEVIN